MKFRKILLMAQGGYFLLTGIWPLLHMPSFLAVTGPKNEVWLVVTVGLLILVIGATLLTAALQRQRERSPELLGFFSALSMGAVDVRYALHDVILDVYLLDAVAEFLLVLAWVWVFFKSGPKNTVDKT
ncbi:hypothetical protein [Rufibacter immobilis]|uniref:hypothetical protein n=1 Tax=Rufibacter immobilis TaxID=1348778 RepID=UPI0035EF7AD1